MGEMMKHVLLMLAVAICLPQSALAQAVWKCQVNGKTTFSDAPCPSSGQMLDQRQLNANTIGAVQRQWAEEDDGESRHGGGRGYSAARSYSRAQSSCPSEQEIRNLETSAGSVTIDKKKREFLQDEVRRARQCGKGQGSYTQDDWKNIKEAQRAQNSLTGGGAARARAEGIHSAADPYEGSRIAEQRRQDERMQEQRRQRAAAAAAAAQHSGPVYCSARGCTGPNGYYPRHGNTDNFNSPDGRFCQHIGNQLQCR